jgi:ornithine cyclodeaminase/alanine dehydrogenase-like protein (mu-crystallin family)
MEAELGVEVRPADSAEEAAGDADVVLVCTNRNAEHDAPALLGDWLRPGMHVTSNGGASELDTSVYERASRVVVDDVHEVRAQIWDVKRAVAAGVLAWDSLDELRFVVAGKVAGRQGDDDITIVRNRGSGVQDLYPTAEMYRRATAQGVGRDLGRVASPLP